MNSRVLQKDGGAIGLGVVFIVLATLTLFLITTEGPGKDVALVYIFFILFSMTFVVISLMGHASKTAIIVPFTTMAVYLVAPILAHIYNNSLIVAVVNLNLDMLYGLIPVIAFALMFYYIFKHQKGIILYIIAGLGLGILLASGTFDFLQSLGVPAVYAITSGTAEIILIGVVAAFSEEIFFRGFLFPLLYRAAKHEEAMVSLLVTIGLVIMFMSDVQWIGWLMWAVAAMEVINTRKKQLLSLNIMRAIASIAATSGTFAIFHVKAYGGSVEMMISAFIFSAIVCSFILWYAGGKL